MERWGVRLLSSCGMGNRGFCEGEYGPSFCRPFFVSEVETRNGSSPRLQCTGLVVRGEYSYGWERRGRRPMRDLHWSTRMLKVEGRRARPWGSGWVGSPREDLDDQRLRNQVRRFDRLCGRANLEVRVRYLVGFVGRRRKVVVARREICDTLKFINY